MIMRIALALTAALSAPLAACNPHVTLDQSKPMEININFTGHLDLVIHDARQDMESITGEKPANTVRPEDIGLPPAKAPSQGTIHAIDKRPLADADQPPELFIPVLLRTTAAPAPGMGQTYTVATADDLKKAMAARNADIQALWNSGAIGESHDGTVAGRKPLTPDQQKLVDAENTDRKALYASEAATKKTKVEDVILGYYLARLGYAKKGAWYEKADAKGAWQWVQWGS